MRRILVDAARKRSACRRGGGLERLAIDRDSWLQPSPRRASHRTRRCAHGIGAGQSARRAHRRVSLFRRSYCRTNRRGIGSVLGNRDARLAPGTGLVASSDALGRVNRTASVRFIRHDLMCSVGLPRTSNVYSPLLDLFPSIPSLSPYGGRFGADSVADGMPHGILSMP